MLFSLEMEIQVENLHNIHMPIEQQKVINR